MNEHTISSNGRLDDGLRLLREIASGSTVSCLWPREWAQAILDYVANSEPRKAVETKLPQEKRETGWLVENGRSGAELRYRSMNQGMSTWTADHQEAIRFARRKDAELFAAEDEDAWCIVEHQWITLDGDSVHCSGENGRPQVGKIGMHPQCMQPNNCQEDADGYCAGCHAASIP